MISDLALQVESVHIDVRKNSVLNQWHHWLHAQDPAVHVLRAGFDAPQAGFVAVEFESIPEELGVYVSHPIAATISGELLSMPAHVSLNRQRRAQVAKAARFLLTVFRSVCESLNPLYGSISVEASLPTPPELSMPNKARLGTELFVSSRLGVTDPRLEQDLATIFAGGFSERWTTGMFFSGWATLNPEGRTVDAPLEVGTRAARRLGQTLKTFGARAER
jgi:hypothetical protein